VTEHLTTRVGFSLAWWRPRTDDARPWTPASKSSEWGPRCRAENRRWTVDIPDTQNHTTAARTPKASMTLPFFAWLLQFATTLPMVGVIWCVQLVVYPQFARVGSADFAAYHRAHTRRISLVVGPLMLGEVAGALCWGLDPGGIVSRSESLVGLLLLGVIWGATALFSVPRHGRLEHGFDAGVLRALVATNWLRTLAWTARGALLLIPLLRNR
jgi:hypothetical protein